VWQAQVALPQEGRLEMKFLVRTADGGLVWQAGNNLAVEVPKGAPGGDAVPAERSFNFAGTWAVGSSRASLTAEGPMAEADIPKPKKEEPSAPAPEPAPPAAEAAAPEPAPPAPEPEAAPAAAEAPAAEAPAAEAAEPTA
jgi:pyruvate dehydrogenase E2 component (dihydrolipoamide acetyltransferase)